MFSRSLRGSPPAGRFPEARDDVLRADAPRAVAFTAVPRFAVDLFALPLREDAGDLVALFDAAPLPATDLDAVALVGLAFLDAAPLLPAADLEAVAFEAAFAAGFELPDAPPRPAPLPLEGAAALLPPRAVDGAAALFFDAAVDFLPAADLDAAPLRPFEVAIGISWK